MKLTNGMLVLSNKNFVFVCDSNGALLSDATSALSDVADVTLNQGPTGWFCHLYKYNNRMYDMYGTSGGVHGTSLDLGMQLDVNELMRGHIKIVKDLLKTTTSYKFNSNDVVAIVMLSYFLNINDIISIEQVIKLYFN